MAASIQPPPLSKQLSKYKGTLQLRQPSTADKLLQLIIQLTIVALWKSLSVLSSPFGKWLALNLWMGKSVCRLSLYVQRQVFKTVGWLAGPAFSPHHHFTKLSRFYFAADVKRWQVGVVALVFGSLASSLIKKWQESFDEIARRRKAYRKLLGNCATYERWKELAEKLSALEALGVSRTASRAKQEIRLYDKKLLQEKIQHLKRVRATGNVKDMMFALRIDLIRNMANIAKSQLHEHFVVIPEPILKYIKEVKEQLTLLTDWPEPGLNIEEKLSFFRETRHTFGRTALLLSGGGGLGTFHLGVVKALVERHLLPRILAGSSVGSIVAAIISTKTDEELRDLFAKIDQFDVGFFNNSKTVDLVHHFLNKGTLHDISFLINKLRTAVGDLTFLEAYERTGRILNITVCPADTNEPPRLLNYLTAPHALIWSAVAASSAFPGLFPAQHLLARNANGEIVRFSAQATNDSLERRWRDGSLELDLPVQALGEMFNCNHFLVSQTNPHIVPLLNLKNCFTKKWANIIEHEFKHRCQQLQWMLPDWVPSKWLTLFTQPWEGDITMILPSSLWHVGKAITNPTTEELMRAVKVGEVATWERISAIECNCSIEATLDKCLAKITNSLRGRQTIAKGLGSKVPSWMHIPGIPQHMRSVLSWGDHIDGADTTTLTSWGSADIASTVTDGLLKNHGHFATISEHASSSPLESTASSDVGEDSTKGELADIIHMAQIGCTDTSVNIWSQLLPLATSTVTLENTLSQQPNDSIDVFAY